MLLLDKTETYARCPRLFVCWGEKAGYLILEGRQDNRSAGGTERASTREQK